ncbi:6-phosphofructokinase [Pasteuria penetrans]|uniref:6-phosphofructokinase n=1 Tax=Pasteuria penetrans TaxID=86005 RepID=UPI000F9500D2|nr:6-phosphofructokinase [Pasteuria penetrans]
MGQRLAVLTSGGDSPGMNAAIRAVVRSAAHYDCEVYGIRRGYAGLLEKEWSHLRLGDVGDIIHRGGTVLHSSRCREFLSAEVRERAVDSMYEAGFDGLVVIGGGGTFAGGAALSELEFPVVGIPGTIDNDIEGTEMSIGFDTAVRTAVCCVDNIRDTAMSHERTFLIEVMGRTAGNIALWVGLAVGAESILIPEELYAIEDIVHRLQRGVVRGKKYSIIIVAEGAAKVSNVAQQIEDATGWDTRIAVLGHIQRGGSPTAADRVLASRMGSKAVDMLLQEKRKGMVALRGGVVVSAPWSSGEVKIPKGYPRELTELATLAHRLSI